jgi:hypothetical protein
MRPSAVVALLLAAAFGVVGCEAIEEVAESVPAEDVSGIVGQPVSNAIAVPVEQVESCVAQIKFGAEIGDALWSEVWNQAGQTDDVATTYCSEIGSAEPARLLAIHEGWLPVEASIAAALLAEQAPPLEAAAPPAAACDPNYEGCVPIASDVDCEGGDGDGPAYVAGPLRVIGSDIYGLDRDGDGWAC